MEIDARSRMGNAEPQDRAAKWVDWYNNVRGFSRTDGVHPLTLLGPIGYITPAEAEEAFYANLNTLDMVA
jgi:transposase InsO family protein